MGKLKDRAEVLARQIRETHRAARAAEMQARSLGEDFMKMLPAVEAEAEMERNIVEYPPGRYECNGCHTPVLFTETVRVLPPCDTCGRNAGYQGPPPRVLNTTPATPQRFAPGLYECSRCHARTALVEGCDSLPPCEFCGAADLRAI